MDGNNNHQEQANNQETAQTNQSNHELDLCRASLNDVKDKYARLGSDFENYKRRIEKEKISWMNVAQTAILTDILAIIDDFDRALEAGKKEEHSSSMLTGFELIDKALYKMLEKYGVVPMKEYHAFDPEKHEALMHVESPEHKSGDIVHVLQKGFMIHNSVLRPAKVSVAK